jgi:hypothetical protein
MASLCETKTPSTTSTTDNSITEPNSAQFYKDKFTRPDNIPLSHFQATVKASCEKILNNPFDHWKEEDNDGNPRPTCKHGKVEAWNLNRCADCHKFLCPNGPLHGTPEGKQPEFVQPLRPDIYEKELVWKENILKEDHQFLSSHSTVTVILNRNTNHPTLLGTGILEEARSSTMTSVVQLKWGKIFVPTTSLKEYVEHHSIRSHASAIRLDALVAIAFDHNCWDWPTWRVVRDLIQPATKKTRCRFCELPEMKHFVGPADVFASHCWSTPFGDLIGALCHGARMNRYVWIDIFAVRQWAGNIADIDFRPIIRKSKAVIVSFSYCEHLEVGILSAKVQRDAFFATQGGIAATLLIPTFRLWCNVEIAAAVNMGIPLVVKCGKIINDQTEFMDEFGFGPEDCKDPGFKKMFDSLGFKYITGHGAERYSGMNCVAMMLNISYMVNVEESKCAVLEDFEREMNLVRQMNGGVDSVNKIIAGVAVGAMAAVFSDCPQVDAAVCGETESLLNLLMRSLCGEEEKKLAQKILLVACSGGRTKIVHLLFNHWLGKEDEIMGEKGKKKKRELAKIEWLRDLINESESIFTASEGGHIEVLKLLLEVDGLNANVASEEGETSLYLACDKDHVEVAKLLLQMKDIDVNQATASGSTPLFIACKNGHASVVELLLGVSGIDVNKPTTETGGDVQLFTPIFMACHCGHSAVVELLLGASGIDIEQAISYIFHFDKEVVRTLLQNSEAASLSKLMLESGDLHR